MQGRLTFDSAPNPEPRARNSKDFQHPFEESSIFLLSVYSVDCVNETLWMEKTTLFLVTHRIREENNTRGWVYAFLFLTVIHDGFLFS